MFWTDWKGPPKIERSSLNGTWRVSIVTSNLSWPSGIALDRRNQLLYWVDEKMYIIESVDYDGNNRKFLFRQRNFFGITFTSSYLFVTEWGRDGVYKVDASNGTLMGFLKFSSRGTRGVVAYDNKINATECPVLPPPSHGTKYGCPKTATYYDTVCQFTCDNGYVGSGSHLRRCQRNGTWSGQDFVCESRFLQLKEVRKCCF
ncbi:low-density lipoprotein receptor-related protein 8-like [Stylophora pistillata]|uniref:low-density lipoprotein receptor-related protein 8-like n=1 Tax=Stylophora pistillata TaxID=50429 RepID=UPI000C0481FD|nr:low-density lipoprotein receptor-related protein 8-like [Stylophora pistillata]